ncbi:hypothetical protein V6U89_17100 [Micromonospora sp. CPCC 206171]|uniref:hypothetical protein n=1 Tax=Micromonospora sp. CPCC 206171 TaxID=3122405 RepID=UPI002FF18BBF
MPADLRATFSTRTQTVSYLTSSVLSEAALIANPLIAGPARHLLAATALAVFPNTSLTTHLPSDDVTPRGLRRAMAYAEDHADRPITVAEMAAAAGIAPAARRQRSADTETPPPRAPPAARLVHL